MSVISRIQAKRATMTPTDSEIAAFILKNPDEMLNLSSVALAKRTGCSQSSVVKFSQRLGYSTYQKLKLAVSEANTLGRQSSSAMIHGTIELGDDFSTIRKKLIGSKVLSMDQTAAANSESDFDKAIKSINKAARIHLVGVGASSLVARDLSYKLTKIGRNVLHDSDSHIQMAAASTLGAGDVLIAFSHSGNSLETLRIAETARQSGAMVIAVTGQHDSALKRVANMCLYTVADEDRVRSSAITARDAQLTLIDLLFVLLVQKQPDARNYIQKSEAAASKLKVKPGKN